MRLWIRSCRLVPSRLRLGQRSRCFTRRRRAPKPPVR
ncbi:hypothetical protein LJE71_19450 [Xanthobacter autotrophicus]|nr:hypothetical protein LJE71_19450 [Xanthobacter autotrophicus]